MHDLGTIHRLLCSAGDSVLEWPPDVFGFAAYFAKSTGVYTVYARQPSWVKNVGSDAENYGRAWREGLEKKPRHVPRPVLDAWAVVCDAQDVPTAKLVTNRKFVRSVLFLLSCADEACAGVGVPDPDQSGWFEVASELLLSSAGNLCRTLPKDTIRVLPKLHTPQSGLNIRSLSHHLALCSASEVQTKWAQSPLVRGRTRKPSFNVLLAPWPLELSPSSFVASEIKSKNGEFFGYMDYRPDSAARSLSVVAWLRSMLGQVSKSGQHIDLVVFPECALSGEQWRKVAMLCAKDGIALIAGVHSSSNNGRGSNAVKFRLPLIGEDLVQHKHHRWQLDEAQIKSYSLGGSLSTKLLWWENIEIQDRSVHFLTIDPDLSMCVLICEDLARQDPVSELVRAVGPNLVVALLMDGPQINGRWASRYASVLADDPGCSVVTLSSLGMVERSKPNGMSANRTIASWQDAFGTFVPIEVGQNDEAVLLNIQFKTKKEWTVDGRDDGDVASFPVLCGVHGLRRRVS